ncbi:MAG: class IV adenylate cyclase [Patescibacteria group bacterium]|jgi:adenylate cyclase class 2
MNVEIERKFKIDNYEELKDTVESLGAEKKGLKTTIDYYFNVPQEQARTKYLRIRFDQNEKSGELAYHEVVDDLQTNEWETVVGDASLTQEILEKLGFPFEVKVQKERTKYNFMEAEILLDKVDGLGEFVEIEAPDQSILNEIVQKLGINEENVVSGLGYPDMIKEKHSAISE